MNNKTTKKEIEPLCYGFISKGNIYFKLKWPFTQEFCFYNRLGNDIINFAWFDVALLETIFEQLFAVYINAKQKKNEYDFIAACILEFAQRYLGLNAYISIYLLDYIDFLLDEQIDRRILSNIAIEAFARDGYFTDADTGEMFDLDKRKFASVFISSIVERQKHTEKTLEMVLNTQDTSSKTALQRYYDLEQNNAAFRDRWNSAFMTKFGKRGENTDGVVQLTVLNGMDDMLRYELVQMLVRDVKYKRCKNCGKLFIPSGRVDSLYCDRLMPSQSKPCKEIGANLAAKQKVSDNPALKLYRQAYQRLNKRVEFGYLSPEEFEKWKTEALPMRQKCVDGELSLGEFKTWLDSTSRQRKMD